MSDMTIQEAIEKMSEFITIMFDRQAMTEREPFIWKVRTKR